ncbi:thiol-disulfide interchange protein [Candidatus Thioglobus autotrophicus]|uniref:Thiol:disulfide interchange protein n=1 Tax=Candidatus Thioglobus autotrophicus TaxID=1705394 RepID=A0A0M5LET0_9GAMM|nr:DsbC family protein [Candidatus Thioglobus autotrophicus]ALE52703.1 thiol-disulfide interchange protein [Candidatus Thioglobus autotrophicus]WPE16731.1 DsbC family protein [Candidatus Thioglobus autotrophicus]
MIKSLFLVITLLSGSAFATKDEVIQHLSRFFGEIDKKDITHSPFKGVYEVITYNPIDSMLISEDGRYLIQGDVVDLTTRSLIRKSNQVKNLKLALLGTINESDKIIYTAADEKYQIHVFTDVDCPFCKRLHNNMEQMNALGITVKYLASPLASLHPKAQGKMQKIWCSKDRNQAMDDYNNHGTIANTPACENPVAGQLAISQQLGVTGTPAIFLADGTHLPGYLPADKLLIKIQTTLGN